MVSPEDSKSIEGRRAFPGGLRPLQQAEGFAIVFHATEIEWKGGQDLWMEKNEEYRTEGGKISEKMNPERRKKTD